MGRGEDRGRQFAEALLSLMTIPGFDPGLDPVETGKKLGGRLRNAEYVREFLTEEFLMKWTLKLERIDELGNLQSKVVGERPLGLFRE